MIAKQSRSNQNAGSSRAYTKGIAMLTLKIITAIAGFGAVAWMLTTGRNLPTP